MLFYVKMLLVPVYALAAHGIGDDGRPPAESHVCFLLTSFVISRIRLRSGRLSMLPAFVGCNCVEVLSAYSIELETSSANESNL